MPLFADTIDRLLRERGESRAELSRAVGVSDAYITKLLNEKKSPPDPSGTELYKRLNFHFGQPDGTFEELALMDRLGRPLVEKLTRAHAARQLLRENYSDHPKVRAFLDEIEELPEERQLQLIELLAQLSRLPPEKLSALEQLILPPRPKPEPARRD